MELEVVDEGMIPIEALKIALVQEEQAIKLYKDLLVKHPVIKDLLSDLVNEEYKHKKLIEDKIRELTKN